MTSRPTKACSVLAFLGFRCASMVLQRLMRYLSGSMLFQNLSREKVTEMKVAKRVLYRKSHATVVSNSQDPKPLFRFFCLGNDIHTSRPWRKAVQDQIP